jgi:hypothetical protein
MARLFISSSSIDSQNMDGRVHMIEIYEQLAQRCLLKMGSAIGTNERAWRRARIVLRHALSETRAFASRHLGTAADNLEVEVGFGDAAPCIAGCAAQTDADLVRAGTHGRTGLFRVLLGSVALACCVKCPVTSCSFQARALTLQ